MEQYKLGEMEQRLADILWQQEPIASRALTELCGEVFSWKRTTTYTMLKRLCDRGLFENRGGTVVALMGKDEFHAAQGEQFLDEAFDGSLPQFFAAFVRRKKLKDKEIDEILRMVSEYREG